MKVPLKARLLRLMRAPGYRRLMAHAADVRGAQEATMRRLAARLGQTRAGRRHDVSRLTRLEELRRLPLVRYDDIFPDVQASMAGEADVMVPGKVPFFATTAGTTGAAKMLPVTDASRREFQEPMNAYIHGIVTDHPRAAAAKILYFVAGAHLDTAPSGAPIGATSGYNFLHQPRLVRGLYAAPYEAFTVADATTRSYVVARLALLHEVSFVVAITSYPMAHLGQVMREHADALLADIGAGTLTPPAALSAKERASLLPFLRAAPARARELTARAARAGTLTPRSAWPSLDLLSAWFHGGAGSHTHELPALFGDVAKRPAVYSATEGWFNVPLVDDDPSGMIALSSCVFEFLPLENGEPNANAPRFAHEIEAGKSYELVVTTGAGIWRYRMGDEVKCTGHTRQAPLIHFVQKTGNVVSLAHDMTTESHVANAVVALRAAGHRIGRYCFAPSPGGEGRKGRYVLFVDASGVASEGSSALADAFDRALRVANTSYEDERHDGALDPVRVTAVEPTRWDAWERANASRTAGAQAKPVMFAKTNAAAAGLADEGKVA